MNRASPGASAARVIVKSQPCPGAYLDFSQESPWFFEGSDQRIHISAEKEPAPKFRPLLEGTSRYTGPLGNEPSTLPMAWAAPPNRVPPLPLPERSGGVLDPLVSKPHQPAMPAGGATRAVSFGTDRKST